MARTLHMSDCPPAVGRNVAETTNAETVRVVQLSDTHFLEDGAEPEGGFAYDTDEAFDAVHEHVGAATHADLVVVTGDVADHGRPGQYRRAAAAFERFDAPVNVCPGNHDQDHAFTIGMGRPKIGTSRVIEAGAWTFLFVDSNAGAMVPHESGRHVDPHYHDRLHRNGALGERETTWIRDTCAAASTPNVFVWLHHPPAPSAGLSADASYEAEWRAMMPELPMVKGFGGGHTHVPDIYEFEGREVHVCPSLKNNFDLTAKTMLPPGYRDYAFAADGTFTSEARLVEDERWPRHPVGRTVMALLNGEMSWDEFNARVATRRAADEGKQ
ncbi:MAG: Icc protein [Candidatus Poriferisodalaceae bacterium]|jgi:Icc protein